MKLIRRQFLCLAAAAVVAPASPSSRIGANLSVASRALGRRFPPAVGLTFSRV